VVVVVVVVVGGRAANLLKLACCAACAFLMRARHHWKIKGRETRKMMELRPVAEPNITTPLPTTENFSSAGDGGKRGLTSVEWKAQSGKKRGISRGSNRGLSVSPGHT